MTAALIIVTWWAVLIFVWSLCRSAAMGDRQGATPFDDRPLLTLVDRERND